MGSTARLFLLLLLALPACSARSGPSGPEFVAEEADFATFRAWTSIQLPDHDPVSDLVYPAGARTAFLNQRPPHGATRYPVGTILVKTIQTGATPEDWEIFGRAKRGGGYNQAGAVDWEFFLLRIGADGMPHITSRGIAPGDDGRGDMELPAAAGGYFAGNGSMAPCNLCHGDPSLASADYIFSKLLTPAATAQ